MPIREVVVATRNLKKGKEILELLAPHDIKVFTVADFTDVPEVIEDGKSFAENACKKASQTAKFLQKHVIGEDSGICVDALDGRPGIYSARYSGENATDDSNNQKLMEELRGIPDSKRTAYYVCHISLANPHGEKILEVERTCRGRITHSPRGTNGFGYDPYFEIPEYHFTFGELDSTVKKYLSHRARAFQDFIPQLLKISWC